MHRLQADLRQKGGQALRLGLAALPVLLLDQATKNWVLVHLARPGAGMVALVPGYLRLEYATNTGAAFSLFNEHPGILAALATALAIAVLTWGLVFLRPHEKAAHLAAGLVFGGAVGNLIDRFRFGHVVDFIVAHWRDHAWPTFNVADSAICAGVGLLVIVLGRAPRPAPGAQPATASPAAEPPRK